MKLLFAGAYQVAVALLKELASNDLLCSLYIGTSHGVLLKFLLYITGYHGVYARVNARRPT